MNHSNEARGARKADAPPSQARTETYQHARREFEAYRSISDPLSIQHRLHVGTSEYKMFRHYFEEQRHFAKPLIKREYPHRRVEMLRSLLKVTPENKRTRLRMLLRKAEERTRKLERLEKVLDEAERASGGLRPIEYEWQGWLAKVKERLDSEKAAKERG